MKPPKPGIYPNFDPARYHAIAAVSNTQLSKLRRSPAHLQAWLADPPEPTEALRIGSAADVLTLTPERFADQYLPGGACAAITKGGEPCGNGGTRYARGLWFCGVRGHAPEETEPPIGKTILTPAEADRCIRIAAAVWEHRGASRILSSGSPQTAIFWRDTETDLTCKALLDWWAPAIGTVADLKTARDASPAAFSRAIADYGYHRQVAFYRAGLAAHGEDAAHCVFLAVEKDPPFAVAAYRLSDVSVGEGEIQARELLLRYAECRASNRWPAYGDDIAEITLPAWAYTSETLSSSYL
jgi:hypothetical protein